MFLSVIGHIHLWVILSEDKKIKALNIQLFCALLAFHFLATCWKNFANDCCCFLCCCGDQPARALVLITHFNFSKRQETIRCSAVFMLPPTPATNVWESRSFHCWIVYCLFIHLHFSSIYTEHHAFWAYLIITNDWSVSITRWQYLDITGFSYTESSVFPYFNSQSTSVCEYKMQYLLVFVSFMVH